MSMVEGFDAHIAAALEAGNAKGASLLRAQREVFVAGRDAGMYDELLAEAQQHGELPAEAQQQIEPARTDRDRSEDQEIITLTIGGNKSPEATGARWRPTYLFRPTIAQRMELSDELRRVTEPKEIDLVRVRVEDLVTGERLPNLDTILEKAGELGYEQCPPQVGPMLKSSEPYRSSKLHIGMSPIVVESLPYVFKLDAGLRARSADRSAVFNRNDVFVFVKPRKEAPQSH